MYVILICLQDYHCRNRLNTTDEPINIKLSALVDDQLVIVRMRRDRNLLFPVIMRTEDAHNVELSGRGGQLVWPWVSHAAGGLEEREFWSCYYGSNRSDRSE